MDKKQVTRFFQLRPFERGEYGVHHTLQMYSQMSGEFGPVHLLISAEIDGLSPMFVSRFIETSGESQASLYSFRSRELLYFCNTLLPLFHPLNVFYDELPPFPSEPEDSKEFPEP